MITKHITFGQQHRHPKSGEKLRNYTVKVQAPSANLIREAARRRFGVKYSMIRSHPDKNHFPAGVYETLVLDEEDQVHCFRGVTSYELLKESDYTFEEETARIAQHYITPEPKKEEDHGNKKNQKPAGERTGGTQGTSQRSEEQASGSSDKEGSSDEDSQDHDYLS